MQISLSQYQSYHSYVKSPTCDYFPWATPFASIAPPSCNSRGGQTTQSIVFPVFVQVRYLSALKGPPVVPVSMTTGGSWTFMSQHTSTQRQQYFSTDFATFLPAMYAYNGNKKELRQTNYTMYYTKYQTDAVDDNIYKLSNRCCICFAFLLFITRMSIKLCD